MAKRLLSILIALLALGAFIFALQGSHFALLEPKGWVAIQQKSLLIKVVLIMLFAAVPAFAALFVVLLRKRRKGAPSPHEGDEGRGGLLQVFIWAVPTVVIAVIGVLNWQSAHELDPMRPLASPTPPMTIQVVSLQWKWLFIYPEQGIATVNLLEIPEGTPIDFELTSDGPMNSFWVPELGGQMYSMAGMSTGLHLIANETGEFNGRAAEISGPGFAGMQFAVKSVAKEDFEKWVFEAKASSRMLDIQEYRALSEPSENDPVTVYSEVPPGLYATIMDKYLSPAGSGIDHAN